MRFVFELIYHVIYPQIDINFVIANKPYVTDDIRGWLIINWWNVIMMICYYFMNCLI